MWMVGCSGEEPMSGCNIWTPFLMRSLQSEFVDNCDVLAVTCNSMERTQLIEDGIFIEVWLNLDQGLLIEVLQPRKKNVQCHQGHIDNACCWFFISSSLSHHASDSTSKRKQGVIQFCKQVYSLPYSLVIGDWPHDNRTPNKKALKPKQPQKAPVNLRLVSTCYLVMCLVLSQGPQCCWNF